MGTRPHGFLPLKIMNSKKIKVQQIVVYKDKPFEDWSFEELVSYVMERILSNFMSDGISGMCSLVRDMMSATIRWDRSRRKKGKSNFLV